MAGTARITIEVVDEGALAKFRELGRASQESFRQVGEAGGHVSAKNFEQTTEVSRSLREVIHTLHPVLEEAGLGLGNLGAFAAAARGGLLGLAAALGGAVLVGLEKIQDTAAQAAKRMKDLGATKADIEALGKAARDVGVEPSVLAEGYESTKAAIAASGGPQILTNPYYRYPPERPPVPGDVSGHYIYAELEEAERKRPPIAPEFAGIDFQKRLLEITRIGAGNIEDATKEYKAITSSLKPKELGGEGGLTAKVIEGLSPGTAHQFNKLFGLPELQPGVGNATPNQQLLDLLNRARGGIGVGDLASAVTQHRKSIDEDFSKLKGGPTQLSDAIAEVTTALRGLAESVAHVGLADELKKIADAINDFAGFLLPKKTSPAGEGTARSPYTGNVELPPTKWEILKHLNESLTPNPAVIQPGIDLLNSLQKPALVPVPPIPTTAPGSFAEGIRTAGAAGGPAVGTVDISAAAQSLKTSISNLAVFLSGIAAQIKTLNLQPAQAGAGGGEGAEGHAGGGHIRGPGTGTSDSIPAMLSAGEYVQPERAVRHYGLGHMEDIRTLRAPRLNAGGFVGGSSVRFNTEGLIASMDFAGARRLADGGVPASLSSSSSGPTHAVHVHLGDGSEHGPMLTDRETAENLVDHIEQQSVLYRLASGGRRSSAQS